jgi:hypothetical protein
MDPTEKPNAEPETPEVPETPETPAPQEESLADVIQRAVDEPDEKPADPPAEGEEEGEDAGDDKGKEGDEAKPGDKPAEQKPEPDQEIEKEIADRKLEGKSADRFRELATQVKELAPIKAALEQAGIRDIAEVPKLAERAKFAEDLVEQVMSTGADAEQYGQALDYLKVVNEAVRSGDPAKAQAALDMLKPELDVLARITGQEIAGIADPLAGYDDLREAVEAGDMTRKHALEVAATRHRSQLQQGHQQQVSQQAQAKLAQEQGVQALVQWEQARMAADPTYLAKRPQLNAMVGWIRQNLPPQQWVQATEQAYATIQAPQPPQQPQRPKPGNVPVRPTGARADLRAAQFETVEDAIMAGINEAG